MITNIELVTLFIKVAINTYTSLQIKSNTLYQHYNKSRIPFDMLTVYQEYVLPWQLPRVHCRQFVVAGSWLVAHRPELLGILDSIPLIS